MHTLLALILAFTAAGSTVRQPEPATAPAQEVNALIEGVDKTFASMKDFSARFIQISTNSVNQRQQDEGLLYLTRGKKMRVNYEKPEEKYWVSDGKTLYTYVPANRQVNQDPVKDSMVEQIPIMFLLGRSGLRKEFSKVDLLSSKPLFEGDRSLRLTPKRTNQDIEVIDIEVNPRTYLVDRMAIRYSDKSSTEFIFMQIEINSRIPDSKFEFTPPAGIRVVKGAGIQ